MNRRFDIVKRYHDWSDGGNGQFPDRYERELGKGGRRILHFAWTSNRWNAGDTVPWKDIASGRYDSTVILPAAERLKKWRWKVFLDFDHEMDGEGRQVNGTPAEYVAAYRHIHEVMGRAGVTNVVWVWVPTGTMANVDRIRSMYPGDEFVDWVGYDPYNMFRCNGSPWESAYEAMAPFYKWLGDNGFADKPIMLGEYGSAFDPARPNRIDEWYRRLPGALRRLPRVKAVVQWNSYTDPRCDFRVTARPEAMAGFVSAANDDYVTTW